MTGKIGDEGTKNIAAVLEIPELIKGSAGRRKQYDRCCVR